MPDDQSTPDDRPLYLLRSSPLVAGGKARLMSARKVKPNRAKPRDVSGPEAHGYTAEPWKGLRDEPQALSQAEWERHIERRAELTDQQRRTVEEIARDRDRQRLSQEQRIVKAQKEARAARRDVSREVWVLEQMLGRRVSPEKIEKRLQGLERIAYMGRRAA